MGGVSALLCSHNEQKARELQDLLPGWTVELLGAQDFPPEDGPTYYDNARANARFGRQVDDTGAWMLGEDSGIEVEGLGGRPGVHSSRSAAGDEVGWMLGELRGVQGEGRRARYVCELVALSPESEEVRGTGTLSGRIAEEARGEEGFGFDPVFVPDGETRTVAELGNEWKRRNSHRARAARALLDSLSVPG